MRRILYPGLLILGSLATSLILAELATRALPLFDDLPLPYSNQSFPPYFASASDYLPITLVPNAKMRATADEFSVVYQTNDFGFRGDDLVSLKKPEGVRRILFLGDSFTLGWGVEAHQSFATRVQDLLAPARRAAGVRYQSINAAYHAGYSPDAYYAFLKRKSVAYQPDLVIICYYPPNDLDDMATNLWLETDETGAPIRIKTLRRYTSWDGKLASGFLWNERIPVLRESRLFMAVANVLNNYLNLDHKLNYMGVVPVRARTHGDSLPTIIKAFDVLAKKDTLEIVHVLIPHAHRIDRNDKDLKYFRETIAANSTFPIIDLSEFLAPENYFKKDLHLNCSGHARVAEVLANAIGARDHLTLPALHAVAC